MARVMKLVILFLPALVMSVIVVVGFPKSSSLISVYAGHVVMKCFVVSSSSSHIGHAGEVSLLLLLVLYARWFCPEIICVRVLICHLPPSLWCFSFCQVSSIALVNSFGVFLFVCVLALSLK